MQALIIFCQRREQEAILDMLEDWIEHGTVTVYGSTLKAHEGFILMHWTQAVPTAFQEKQLKADPGITDYLIYDMPPILPQSDTPTM